MKVDLERAYDRINWDYLRWVLMDLGLLSNWTSLIMHCVSNTDFSLLWNREKLDLFTPAQGVRQGNPLIIIQWLLINGLHFQSHGMDHFSLISFLQMM